MSGFRLQVVGVEYIQPLRCLGDEVMRGEGEVGANGHSPVQEFLIIHYSLFALALFAITHR
ncbi:hypothetical protein CSQ80_04860 [Cyanobacterium aponinum IPPAS B-1201]|nr:hypothetical protein CSQ80_04860 [Cyanobacterium aponinum IPPAS B-1201]